MLKGKDSNAEIAALPKLELDPCASTFFTGTKTQGKSVSTVGPFT